MKKMLTIFLLMFFLIPSIVYAHPGRTDSNGGHTNKSTGEYHYHHGYSAHQHTNSECPYDFLDKTSYSTSYSNKDTSNKSNSASNDSSDNDTSFITFVSILSIVAFCTAVFLRRQYEPTIEYHYRYPKSKAEQLPPLKGVKLQELLEKQNNKNYYDLLTDMHYDYLSNNEILLLEKDKKLAHLDSFSYYTSTIIGILGFVFICILLNNGLSPYFTLGIAIFIIFFTFCFKIYFWGCLERNIESEYKDMHSKLLNSYNEFLIPYISPLFINQIIGAPTDTTFENHLPIFQDNSHIKYVSRTGHCYHDKRNCKGNFLVFKHAFLCDTLSCCPFCGTHIVIPDWYKKYRHIMQILNDFNINTDNL